MTEQQSGAEQRIERGAAEDASGSPVTQTEVDASRHAPSEPGTDSRHVGPGESRTGYDVNEVSGDTDAYRPE